MEAFLATWRHALATWSNTYLSNMEACLSNMEQYISYIATWRLILATWSRILATWKVYSMYLMDIASHYLEETRPMDVWIAMMTHFKPPKV